MASVNYSKVTKTFGQVTPRDTDAITVEPRLDKKTIVLGSHSYCAQSAGKQVLNPLPLIITESKASWGHQIHLQKGKGPFPKENETPSEDQVPI